MKQQAHASCAEENERRGLIIEKLKSEVVALCTEVTMLRELSMDRAAAMSSDPLADTQHPSAAEHDALKRLVSEKSAILVELETAQLRLETTRHGEAASKEEAASAKEELLRVQSEMERERQSRLAEGKRLEHKLGEQRAEHAALVEALRVEFEQREQTMALALEEQLKYIDELESEQLQVLAYLPTSLSVQTDITVDCANSSSTRGARRGTTRRSAACSRCSSCRRRSR